MAIIEGNAQGVDDILVGGSADDKISGRSGDDLLNGGGGQDIIEGGKGSDVLRGGTGADSFVWSAGHITGGGIDYVTDFSLSAGDTLKFLDSEGQVFEVVSVMLTKLLETEFNGHNLHNNVLTGTDIVFTVYNALTDKTQEIALLDAWSAGSNDEWVDYLATLGLEFA
jgi:RTX calcium-binding nonapeptide repeat (4 copies)